MAKRTLATRNIFINATKNSMDKFANISTDVVRALSSSPFPTLFNDYELQHVAFMNALDAKKNALVTQKNCTQVLTQYLDELPDALDEWIISIQSVYKPGTPEYNAILDNGRKPFNTGKQLFRIRAVKQLGERLAGIVALATVKTSVDDYYTKLNTALDKQKSSKTTLLTKSRLLTENWRNACESAMFVYGGLTQEFNNNMAAVADYIPFHLLNPGPQMEFSGLLPANAIKMIAKRTMKPDAEVTMGNNSAVSIDFYVSATKEGKLPIGATPVTVQPGMTVKVPVTDLGSLENKYFTVRNTSDIADADYELSL